MVRTAKSAPYLGNVGYNQVMAYKISERRSRKWLNSFVRVFCGEAREVLSDHRMITLTIRKLVISRLKTGFNN